MNSEIDIEQTIDRYRKRYSEYGYSPKTLGWNKNRQYIRFKALTSLFQLDNIDILDIGCGFGDLNKLLVTLADDYKYTGIDIVEELIREGRKHYNENHINFVSDNFLEYEFDKQFDIAVASGIFNHKLKEANNYDVIEKTIEKALNLTRIGIAFDFLSDKVDYKLDHTFHCNPEKLLDIAYKFSRKLVLRNDYMPFELALFIFKDDSFNKKAVFNNQNLKYD